MKFICTKDNLTHALDIVSPLASKHNNLPILMNVLLEATESGVKISCTNLEVAIRVNLRAKVESVGNFTVPAKTLADYVRLIVGEQIEISKEENDLVVRVGTTSTKIRGAEAEDFPVVPEVDEKNGFVIDARNLRESLLATLTATAKNEIRPELAGVFFGFFTEHYPGLVLAATDSYRLAEKKIKVEQGDSSVSVIVPGRTALEFCRVIGSAEKEMAEHKVRLWVGENQIAMRYDDFEMTSRLVDGKYPDYTQIIPASFKTEALLQVGELVNNIRAASLFSTSGVNSVSFDFNIHDGTVGVSSASSQTGEHSSTMEGEVKGEENSILLNYRYVLEGLQHMSGDVLFNVNGPDAPCLFKQKDRDDFLYIVMPIRQ